MIFSKYLCERMKLIILLLEHNGLSTFFENILIFSQEELNISFYLLNN